VAGFTIHVDTREKYAFRFTRRDVAIEHTGIEAGDYGVRDGDRWLAVVERKSIEDLIGSLSNGTLAYQLAAMAELPLAAVVVEGRYPKLFELPRVRDGWLPDVLARLQIRYREIPIVFADSRKFAEEWTYRSSRRRSPISVLRQIPARRSRRDRVQSSPSVSYTNRKEGSRSSRIRPSM